MLLTGVLIAQGDNTGYLINVLRRPGEVPAGPFGATPATRVIANGPLRGDLILAINGRPFNAGNQYDELIKASRPGDMILLTLSEPDGRVVERTVTIPSRAGAIAGIPDIAVIVVLKILIPLVALGLGFAVAALRPEDWNAWLVLFLMVGFTELVQNFSWRGPVSDLRLVWDALWNTSWPISMMLFGIYFPTRSARDKRRPWIKYVAILVFVAIDLGFWGTILIWRHNINAAERLGGTSAYLYFLQITVAVVATLGVLANFRRKIVAETSADARRRLTILRAGSWISLGPLATLALYAVLTQRNIFSNVAWPLTVSTLLLLTLFPLTLAHVIVVERAMDLRFVIRMGVKYGLARFGLWAGRAALVGIAIYIFAAAASRRGMSWSEPVELSAVAGALLILRKKGADRASLWIDRRFFREAYDAEKILRELASEVGRYLEIKPLLERVGRRIGETLHVNDIVILLREDNSFRTAYSTRPGEPMDIPATSRIVANLQKRAEPLDIDFEKPPLWVRSLNAEELQTLDYMRTQLLLPIFGKDQLAGIVSLGGKLSEAPYSETDLRLLQAVAWQAGMALENSRLLASLAEAAAQRERINTEIEIAKEVQERLFPQNCPKIPGLEYAGYCRPAQGVGGDYYDFLQLPDGKLGIAIGDVSGKGIAAALLMASLQASLRGQVFSVRSDLATLMVNVNRLVFEASTESRYATFFYGEYDPLTREFHYVNAGHNPPFVLRGNETIRLCEGGPVVGLLPGARYEQGLVPLHPGDVLIAFTDGVSEAMADEDIDWGEERFVASAKDNATLEPLKMIEAIFCAADAFTAGAKQYDDMTLVVLKVI